MNSMTGFGSASHRDRKLDLEVEVRSVNHRFFTLKQSLPEALSRREADVDRMARDRVGRGSMSMTVSAKRARSTAPTLPDLRRLKETFHGLRKARRALGMKGDVEFADLLAIPGLWSNDRSSEPKADLWPKARKLVATALDALVATRAREGKTIQKDLKGRLDAIDARIRRIRARAPRVIEGYQKRLDDRIKAVLAKKGLEVAQPDLAREVALYSDRCDVSEELQRLGAHVVEFRNILRLKGPIGRRLDFLTQEMMRETNTIASKGNDAAISACAVEVKAEIEKIKEQVENVE